MEHTLARLPIDSFGLFKGILNAIEAQVEEQASGDPGVVRILGDALLTLAAVHHLKPATVKKLTQVLGQLHGLVVDRAACRPRR